MIHGNDEEIMDWLPDIINAFMVKYAPSSSATPEIEKQIQMAMDLKKAIEEAGSISNLSKSMAQFFTQSKGSTLNERTAEAAQSFAIKFPRLSNVARFFKVGFWAGGIYLAVRAFMNWKDLDNKGKATAILSSVTLIGKMITSVPEILSVGSLSMANLVKARNIFAVFTNLSDFKAGIATIERTWLGRLANYLKTFFDAGRKAITAAGSMLEKFFIAAKSIMKWFGVIVSAAFAVMSTIEFIQDLKSGVPTTKTVFDGIIMASSILSTVCIAIGLFVAATIFSIAAAIFAIVGIVAAIIYLFVPKPKPESPVDPFMKETLIPWVDKLDPVPSGWTPGGTT